MRIDSHQHFWIYDPEQYPWMTDELSAIRADHLPNDLRAEFDQVGLDGSVAVQARQSLEESRWLLELADQNELIKGVVGWVDLRSDSVEEQLAEFAVHPKFVGVRHVVQDEPNANFMLLPEFVRGIAKLKAFGLSYDILIFPKQLPAAIELVKQFPKQPFVLDHIAKPIIKDGVISPWDKQIRELAKFENLTCKVSGMVTEANWTGWQPTDFRPYLDVVFEAYGEDRVMYGSDWPVCKLAGSYRQVYGLAEEYVSSFSAEAREKFFGGVASAFYGLKG
ncbi:MAG: amidohydrolase [Opitutia bacterium TMED102]|nr:amidohydrolase [Verrucomicrobiales bacterium]OUV38332.1 MAG: amidohydrolase [Opitutae bacterium TMED102]